jgi:hypothetical protein
MKGVVIILLSSLVQNFAAMRKIILLVLLLQCTTLVAQPYIEIAGLHYGSFNISSLYKGKDEWRVKNDWLITGINLPLKIGKRDYLLLSPSYEQKRFHDDVTEFDVLSLSTVQSPVFYEETFYSAGLPITYIHTLNDTSKRIIACYLYHQNWSSLLNPGWTTDQHGGAFIYSNNVSPKFTWKAGLYYNREFYGDYIMPLLGFEWTPNEKLFLWGLLPNNATLDFTNGGPFHIGINYRGVEDSYSEGFNDYFHLTEGEVEFFGSYYLPHTPLAISVEVGQTVAREYEYNIRTYNGDVTTKTRPAESLFFRAGIAMRVVTDKRFRTRF